MIILRTLVVDDEPGMRSSIKRALSKFKLTLPHIEDEVQFDVDVAENGEEAVRKINANRPDLLLLDYKLPGISGLEILEQVKATESEMITIMITAYASIETAVTAVKRGAFDFLAKPFTPEELKNVVSKGTQRLILAREVEKLAREKHQVRFQFISVLGHELKSPLNSIEGYLDIMQHHKLGADIASYDTMINRCLVRIEGMRKMILDLLDLTRIESGQKKRELIIHNIVDSAKMAIESVLPETGRRNIVVNLDSEDSILFLCDSGEIEIIFNNLISNAVKYNRDGGKVNIHLAKRDGQLEIKVEDTGIGMTREEASKLFNEFVRIKNAKTRDILGSGLGLTILKKITSLYQGTIDVKSEPDAGSTFTVTLHESAQN
ncbi:MAG: sensor histidine kinase [Candidatus Zhuqueibacterota bacterium]